MVAHYQYDAFGNLLASSGAKKDELVYHFSTKPLDQDLGLVYYNFRYYSPRQGRWLNRDPIEEQGGVSLYGFIGNDPVGLGDYLGLDEIRICPKNHPEGPYGVYWIFVDKGGKAARKELKGWWY